MSADRTARLDPRQLQLKKLAKALVEAVGGVDAAAQFCRAGKSQLSDYGNRNVASFMPVDVVVDLEAVAADRPGHPIVTRWLAGESGFDLVRRPDALPSDLDFCAALSVAVGEFTQAQTKILAALPNGVTAAEVRAHNIRAEIGEAIQALRQLEALAERAEDGA